MKEEKSSMFDQADVAILFIVMICAGILGLCIGLTCATFREHKNAVEAGVGHYAVNPTNGVTEFVYQFKSERN
jgi:hypothetical protein